MQVSALPLHSLKHSGGPKSSRNNSVRLIKTGSTLSAPGVLMWLGKSCMVPVTQWNVSVHLALASVLG